MPKKYFLIFKFFFCFFLFSEIVYAKPDILVTGNRNISSETIKEIYPSKTNDLSKNIINNYQKKLSETGFFENVNIKVENNKIIIFVSENPIVNFFYIEGLKKKSILDKIYDLVETKESKIFSYNQMYADLKLINNYLKNLGYNNNKITFDLKKLEDNKINVFYRIELNDLLKIKRIFFIGNKFFKQSTLLDIISSKEDGWWKFFSNTQPSQDRLEYDASLLKKFYLDQGFYDIQILSKKIEIFKNNKQANIIFSINSGKRYYLKEVFVKDNTKKINNIYLDYITALLNKNTNRKYNKTKISKSILDVRNYLESKNLDLEIQINDYKINENKINLSLEFYESKTKQQVRYITFKGNNITNENVLRNNIIFSEGDFVNIFKLKKSSDLIESTKIFEDVKYSINSVTDGLVDVIFSVNEKASGEISAGAGFGTDGAQISTRFVENNFLGRGITLSSNLDVGTNKILGNVLISNPDFYDSGNRLNVNLFATKNTFENAGFENKIVGSALSMKYGIFENIYFSPGIEISYDDVNPTTTTSDLIKKSEGGFYTNKIIYQLEKVDVNKITNPTEGHTIGFGQQLSLPPSDIIYLENEIFGAFYKEISDNFNGSIKYGFSSINSISSSNIKFSDRLFISSKNLKGFAPRGIGPKINSDYVGGNYSSYTTLSSTFPNGLPESWNAKSRVFFDTANLWGSDYNNNDNESNKIRSSVGLGLEWVSPLGPVSASYAEPITKKSTDKIEQFSIKIGTLF